MKTKPDRTPDLADVINNDFVVSATTIVSRTSNLYSARIGAYVLMIGLAQFLMGFAADLIFFSSSPFIRPFYTATLGTDPFSFLTTSLNLIGFFNSQIILNLVFYLVGIIFFATFGGGAIKYTLDIYRNPSESNAKESLIYARSRAGSLITIQLIIGSLMLLIASPILLLLVEGRIILYPISPYSYLNALGNFLPMILICLSGVVFISVRFATAPVVAIAENLGAVDSLRKAWELTSGNAIHTFKGILLLLIVLGSLTGVLSFLALMLFFGFSVWMTLIPAAINQLFLSPIFFVFSVILYMDLLARKQIQINNWWNKPARSMNEENQSDSI
ncbi:MAG: hypothetical protein ACTSR9_15875 [Candidatus Thorarchaeota archaeon]